ncbi:MULTISPECIES: TonB-dependent receptor plug domain-containing protein [unclassified Paracoccus (in: a-proteobacteria)]|uniref:TonB-dependent receptor plug domain-containing protein n=1 Tax=unclassified Paracoccus (in: a-proteobacteria) TaxID=2688777 RepID=UPI0012B383BF|nr:MULTISPECIES: TonB-dependent receptor [unclassified Paracoccus (in: a-proteobacteria)]UXU76492.1 TonB-dependent receptor [Paracoccus sp. SMMA_5]UXU82441.1 TonB-dependent receptor [Paracoccus sp. SMMA_5_TC]
MTLARSSILALTAALSPAAALAQDAITLQPLILSAGFTPVPGNAYGRAYTVLDEQQIARRGSSRIQDALRTVPGVSVNSVGPSYTQLRVRGSESGHALLLIDGIEATGSAEEYILSGLETANIERIEVLRGPQSVFYGSNAAAGVINIISRGTEPGLHYGASAELGNGAAATAHVSHNGESGGLALNLSARDDHGFDQSGDGGEKDGINRKTIALSGWIAATPDWRMGASLRRADESYGYDGTNPAAIDPADFVVDDPNAHSDRDERQGALWTEFTALDGRLVQRLEYQKTDFRQSFDDGPQNRGRVAKLKYRATVSLDGQPAAQAGHLLNIMAERQRDDSSVAPDYRRRMSSVAVEYRGFLDNGLDVQAGLRRDLNQVFADATSWNLGLSWAVPDRPFRLHGSAGKGIVNPSYWELFADATYSGPWGTSVYRGNPLLRPQQNRGFDLGVEWQLPDDRGSIDVTWFRETLRDEIEDYLVSSDGTTQYFSYRNQSGDSPRQGVEVSAQLRPTDRLDVGLAYTYLDATNPDGSIELRRPRHEVGLTASLAVLDGRGRITADYRHVSGNYDTRFFGDYATAELPAINLVNLSGGYDIDDNLRATLRVVNLFDQRHSESWGYYGQGRTAYAGLEARW